MSEQRQWSRRELLRTTLAASVATAAGLTLPGAAWADSCVRTPRQEEGPFYMNHYDRTAPIQTANDLRRVPGAARSADGEPIVIAGRLTDWDCRPIEGGVVEIWQACASGRYAHARDPNPAPMDPNFRYVGEFVTGKDGEYQFLSIKPGAYPIGPGMVRPPHVHFKITGGMAYPIFITQMYFAGEALNEKDPLLNSTPKAERSRLVIEPGRDPATRQENLYRFDASLSGYGPNQRRD